ncbi:filamentous hemagglutinin N-terminal domain-containing protein [Nostoc sp. FACHB-280]|uniref:two-partner secretion domain-containing protein n=1 Tax=Nostoc sp. FACHB-280 TaxID=2692839 RepID=UPI00168A5B63|nr:filamentous hemagglutinin N-terminal domain-containing protein [Nostoc sp. FACHB-280]MBD2495390.1 filamentous hemagglutinin N-terminal domain-containing protein [Nostoc sp. FACHB-280]
MDLSQAQIVTDTSLPKNSAVAPLDSMNRWKITEGTVAGNNLFHSFQQFSIPEMHIADFVNPSANIQNILVRVTGGSRSDIFGTLKTSGVGSPNLFLLNPNGILFGPNASLNVGGSFVATTANAIAFGNQGLFSASVPNNPALLTVNPSAFLFNQINNSSITNKQANLSVEHGQSLLLLGGNIYIDGGSLSAPGGRIELGAVAGQGTVGLNINNHNFSLAYPQNLARGDISIINGSASVESNGGSSLTINARNLEIAGSQLTNGIVDDGTQAGDITLNATERISITQNSTISNNLGELFLSAVGNTGGIYINTKSFSLSDSFIRSDIGAFLSSAIGNTKGVHIQAESLSLNNSTISSDVNDGSRGNTGGINIAADSVYINSNLSNSPTGLSAITSGLGTTNGVFIKLNNSLVLNNSFINTRSNNSSTGNASNIDIQARDIFLINGSSLDTSSSSNGSAGNIVINTQGISLDNRSSIRSETNGIANPGLIDIKARTLTVANGAAILSRTTGSKNGGNIQINASESIKLIGFSPNSQSGLLISGLFTSTENERGLTASGNAGSIDIKTRSLQVTDGAVISARSRSIGNGGNINIVANTVDLAGGGQILTSAFNSGNAGNITIEAKNRVSISGSDPTFAARVKQFGSESVDNDGANSGLFARVRGTERANAGNITVNARSLRLNNQGTITTGTTAGEGGNINLNVRDVVLLRKNSSISANAGVANAGGNGGNININTKFLIAIPGENSDISANAFNGRGGRVDITAQSIFGIASRFRDTQFSDITASSQLGINGDVTINTLQVDPIQGLSELSTSVVDSSTLLAADCSKEDENNNSQFVVTGRGGLPANPYELLGGDVLWSDTRTREVTARRNQPTNIKLPAMEKTVAIAPANGWRFNGAGEVTLISRVSGAEENLLKSNPYACPKQER